MITASIVTFNTPGKDLRRLIGSLLKSPVEKLFIVDQSDKSPSAPILPADDRIVYLRNPNKGYGAGHNVALRKSSELGATYHAVINPDVYWVEDVITSLRDYMDKHPECGLIMPKVLYPDGRIQHLCKKIPSPTTLFVRRFIPLESIREPINRRYEIPIERCDNVIEVPVLSGCFMFLRNSVIEEVGMFDERFFLYAEDVDLCRRIGEIATTIYYPFVSIFHEYAKSSYSDRRMRNIHIRSMIKYFNKWGWVFDRSRTLRNKECLHSGH